MKLIKTFAAVVTFTFFASAALASGDMPTRNIANGTPVTVTVGTVVMTAALNDCRSSRELISRLPFTMTLNRYSHDYCGVMEKPLQYDEKDVHNGWMNGDIDFARDGNYFTILFEDESNSKQYGHQITLGALTCPLSTIKGLNSEITVKVELAKKK